MKRHHYYYPLVIVILAIVLGLAGWFTESSSIRWVALAFGLALIAVGLGLYSLLLALHTEKRATELGAVLTRIEGMAEEMRKEQTEQKERKGSSAQIIPTLQAISQYYTDYLNKQKGEDNK
ncbi:hypothetical protein ACFLWS_06550 [Chloroflexota bacterium]